MLQDKIEDLYSTFIAKRTYSRWLEEEKRRESWEEAVYRYRDYFGRYVPEALRSDFQSAIEFMVAKETVGSMRALWAAGDALEENSFASFNCAFITLDSLDKFGEMLYVLMHGTGMGFSVERQFTTKLPEVPTEFTPTGVDFVVEDSKLGWKEAFDHCIFNLYAGLIPSFDYTKVRPKGARLKTFGGRASGPDPLKQLFNFTIKMVTGAKGRRLNSLEVHDLATKTCQCVVVGGVRRSAGISFSNLSDQRMKHAKDGQFWVENSQRSLSNNSVAYTEKPDAAIFMEEWLNLMRSGSGERGIFNVTAAREKADKFGRMAGDVRSNPCCFTGDMKLLTADGYRTFEELAEQENTDVLTLQGKASPHSSVWCVGAREVVEVKFQGEAWQSITCTPDHVFMLANGEECEAKDLAKKRVKPYFKIKDSFERVPFMAGFIQGDGCTGRLLSTQHQGLEINIGVNDLDVAKLLNAEVVGRRWYSTEAKSVAEHYNLSPEPLPARDFPDYAFGSHEELCDFLSGMWSANGSVIRGHRVAYKATNLELVKVLKEILLEDFGINSYITTNKTKLTAFSNGSYQCRESYDLNISRSKDILCFAEEISFVHEYKRAALRELILTKAPQVSSVVKRGVQKVYDFNEPVFNWGVVEGVVVHNCEALLMDRQLCNLSEVVVRTEDTKETLETKIRAAVLLGCIQAMETNFKNVHPDWLKNAEAERLIGVSLTGTCDSPLFKKVNDKTGKFLRDLHKYAHACAEEFAKELGIVTPKQITLTKPSGTVSQLCNSASGLHPRYSDYYIRRVRVTAKDPIAYLLLSKGVPCNPEVGETWEEYSTLVFEFPMKSPRGSLNRTDFTAIEQLEYWKMFNDNWCDGNPSVTIYVKEEEWVEVGAWVYKNWDSVCGLSFLPYDGGNYLLAPYEEITREEYHNLCKMYAKVEIDFDLELNQFEQEDNTTGRQELACSGGNCEI